jgi:hypothetical protein
MRVGCLDSNTERHPHIQKNFDGDIESRSSTVRNSDSSKASTRQNMAFILKENLKTLQDPEVYREYKLNKKVYFDIMSISPTIAIFTFFQATRFSIQYVADESPLFVVAHIMTYLCVIIFWPYFISQCVIYWTPPSERRPSFLYRTSEYILYSFFSGRIEDLLLILYSFAMGFILLARVQAGQCESSAMWESQRYITVLYNTLIYTPVYSPPPTYSLVLLFRIPTCFFD